jgi:YggT family protein
MRRVRRSSRRCPCRPHEGPVHVKRFTNGLRAMHALLDFINLLLNMYMLVLFAAAIMSWLVVFNVVNTRHPAVAMIGEFLYRITEPVLRPIRERLPNFGGLDISFVVVMLIIIFIQRVIIGNLE